MYVPQKIWKMKILVINWQDIKNPFGGGAEVHMHEIFKRIASWGHQVTIFACEIDGEPLNETIDGIEIIRKGSRSTFNFGVPGYYKKHFEHRDFDIVVDNINKIPFYTPLYVKKPLLGLSHHFFGTSIFREANFVAGSYVYFSEFLVNYVYKRIPFAVVSQSTLDEFISRGFNSDKFTIVPNAIAHEEFPMKVGEKYPNTTITYFGRLKKYKSVDHLFYAFTKIINEIPEAELHILGRGDFRPTLEKIALELNIADKTKFFGFVSEEEKREYLGKSHLVVNTSMKEGWGITNIEANACGTPVLSANVPGLRDSVKVGLSGELYKYGNIGDLADRAINILTDTNKKRLLEEGAVEWASQFSWDESAKIMLEKCSQVIKDFSLSKR